MSEPTKDELIAIANNFLLNSPPGEFNEVVTDVRGLLKDETLINETAPATFREYNTEQYLTVQSPNNDHLVLITKHGEVADGEFLDPRGRQVVQFDHIRQEAVGARAISHELDNDVEPYRAAIEEAAFNYVSEHYQNGGTTVYGSKAANGAYVVTICISSSKFNPTNFWNGRWRSTWTITFNPGAAQATLNGVLKITVHYYEDGNVQLNTNSDNKLTSPLGDPEAAATAILKAISKAEQNYQTSLEQSYNTMGDTTFKALRRALPITKTRIDWSKMLSGTYKVGKELNR